MLLQVIPSKHLEELGKVLLDILHRELALVDRVEPALEESLGHLQVGFLDEVVAHLEREEIVALAAQLGFDLRVDELLELLGALHVAGGEGHLEELLIDLRLGELADLGDLQLELGVDALQFRLLDLQAGGALRRIAIEFVDVHLRLVAHLLAEEGLAILLAHRDQTHIGILDLHLAVVERDGQRLVRGNLPGIDQTAEATQEVRTVVVVHLLLDLDLVVGQLVLLRQVELDLRSLADLEHELELLAVVEVEGTLLLRGDHIAQIVDILLLEILENGVRRLAVGLLGQHALAVHFPDDAHGDHARTEARNVGLALVLAQCLVDLLRVILLAHGNLDERGVLLALFSYDIHIESVVILFSLSESGCKDTK